MIEFLAHPECQACALYELSKSPGIPTRMMDGQTAPAHDRALVVIGQNPGATEDESGKSWQGWAGSLLNRMLSDVYELSSSVDIYLTNAARCRTPRNKDPGKAKCAKCWQWLREDLDKIVAHYGDSNVYVLAMGGPAVALCTGDSIRRAVIRQGSQRKFQHWPDGPMFPMFFTYHPAATAPGRNPSLLQPMDDHMRLLKDFIEGRHVLPALPRDPLIAPISLQEAGYERDYAPPVVSLDIETYGMLEGVEQTVFHPQRMVYVDKRKKSATSIDSDIILRVALAWEDSTGKPLCATYAWADPKHRRALTAALSELPPSTAILGMNICFDISVLRFCDPALAALLRLDRFRLEELAVLNHLDSDMRPERSLKAVSTLFQSMDYESMTVNASRGLKAKSADDPNLIIYNCGDALATLRNYRLCLDNIVRQHGPDHPALHERMTAFRSDLIWIALHMLEAGIPFDRAKLEKLHTNMTRKSAALALRAYSHNLIVQGKGSEKSITAAIMAAMNESRLIVPAPDGAETQWIIDDRVKLTDVKKEISTGKDNIHLMLSVLSKKAATRNAIRLIEGYRTAQKIWGTYTGPLLTNPAKGCDAACRAWPTWFPVPGHIKDDSATEGGTRQGRFSAKDPAAQTFPPPVQKCITSRYGREGVLAAYDMSQVELRMAALLSGDPAFMDAYNSDPEKDNHYLSAKAFWPDMDPSQKGTPLFAARRQVGKRGNFLALYRGGPQTLIESVRADIGYELPTTDAYGFINAFDRLHATFRRWQDELIAKAVKDGYIVLPTGWKRTFLGGLAGAEASYINEMCNLPVQTLAAQCVQSSQAVILRGRMARNLTFQMSPQIHDSVYIDCHVSCFAEVDALVMDALEHSPLWAYLEQLYGRHVRSRADRKILHDCRIRP